MIAGVHDQPIGDEEQIELAALGDLRALQTTGQLAVAGRGALVAPAGEMIAGAEPEHAEMHWRLTGGHVWLAPRDMIRLRRHQLCKRSPD